MDDRLVSLRDALVDRIPLVPAPLLEHLIAIGAIIGVFAGCFALTTLVERKALGRIQNRLGPNRVGPMGLLQPVADGLKMIFKEDIVPRDADRIVHFLAPVLLVLSALLSLAVIPFSAGLTAVDLPAGLLFFFAVSGLAELAVFMAGWSSRNKYALMGAMRAIAQMISYEIPLVLSATAVVLATGTLSLPEVARSQAGGLWNWHAATPWGIVALPIFLMAALAESNRSPFDIPEAESEIIAGHMTEYSGFKYALFFMAEYLGLFAMSGLAVTLFLGSYHAPLPFLDFVPGLFWFFGKLAVLTALFIWIRGTLPRLRTDQLMQLAWKFMLPMTLAVLLIAALTVRAGTPAGWLSGAPLLLGAWWWLGRDTADRRAKRRYRLVE